MFLGILTLVLEFGVLISELGKDGKTKFAIENASRTRVVVAGSKIHILGGFKNIHIAQEAIVSLILGAAPGKVYGNLRTVASRMKERF